MREAIAAARARLKGDPTGRIQIWGNVEPDEQDMDMRCCVFPDRGESTVFHADLALSGGYDWCRDCGASTAPNDYRPSTRVH